jgi:hypothetical protein
MWPLYLRNVQTAPQEVHGTQGGQRSSALQNHVMFSDKRWITILHEARLLGDAFQIEPVYASNDRIYNVRVKAKFCLCFTEYHTMNTYG